MDLTPPGTWITIDGPAGTGKSTTCAILAELLTAAGHPVHRTQQPSRGPFGTYARQAIATLDGYPLASIITADRYQHVDNEILPALATGTTVICDRYVLSAALDLLRGVTLDVLLAMHAALPMPTLAVLLDCEPDTAAHRVAARGAHSRWQTNPDNSHREQQAYQQIAALLCTAGWPLLVVDTTTCSPSDVAQQILARLQRQIPAQPSHSRAEPHPSSAEDQPTTW